jgi:hypothetical protein
MNMSEARFNDLVYLTLKKLYFEPIFGIGASPRGCDIRICMNLSCPSMIKSINAAILLPNEIAPRSHTIFYNIDTDKVFDECKDYMENHWLKQEISENWLKSAKDYYNEEIIRAAMSVSEEECGIDTCHKTGEDGEETP